MRDRRASARIPTARRVPRTGPPRDGGGRRPSSHRPTPATRALRDGRRTGRGRPFPPVPRVRASLAGDRAPHAMLRLRRRARPGPRTCRSRGPARSTGARSIEPAPDLRARPGPAAGTGRDDPSVRSRATTSSRSSGRSSPDRPAVPGSTWRRRSPASRSTGGCRRPRPGARRPARTRRAPRPTARAAAARRSASSGRGAPCPAPFR